MILRLAALLLLPGAAIAALDGPARSVSSSKQFVVYSNDSKLRSLVSMRAEDNKREFLDLLGEKDAWKTPIIIQFGPPPNAKRPPRYRLGIFESDNGGNKIQLDVYDPAFAQEPEFDAQILSALALEYMYRKAPAKAGRSSAQPVPWFVQGLGERIRERSEGSQPAGIYSTLLSGADAPRLGDFLDTQPDRLDATSRSVYRAQAAALVDAIIALEDGRAGLRNYLSAPRRWPGDANEIVSYFPSLGGNRDTLGRKWVLAMARASASNRTELMSERETAKELDDILAVKALPDPKHPEVAAMSGPYALPTIARSRNGRFILAQLESSLLRLSLRAHPLYQSVVEEYLRIVRDLAAKPKRHEDKRIAAAEEMRVGLTRETSDVRDYMDWVETTKIKTASPDLGKVLDDVDELEEPPARTDAISRYLDAVSERGW